MLGMEFKGIRGITFDAGGTLIAPHPGVGAIYSEIAQGHGVKTDPAELDSRFRSAFKRMRGKTSATVSEDTERQFWTLLTRDVFSGIADSVAFDTMFPDLWSTFALPARWRPIDGSLETLSKIRERGFRLAVLSNFDSRLHPVLKGLGFTDLLEAVFISAEVGVAKPETGIFDHAAGRLGMESSQMLHVGDNPIADGAGAVEAGWSVALLGSEFPGAVTIERISELPSLLG